MEKDMSQYTLRSKELKVSELQKQLQHVNFNAAGIDVGSDRHLVAVPEGRDDVAVREFGAFTVDLHALANWLSKCGVTTVAMESTGVYWIPVFELLERLGFEVKLVDARKVKNVTGRKSDVLDCQWLQQLESYGLLEGAFRPSDEIVVLRGYMRQREMLVKSASTHIQHMQKALQQMNLRLDNVVSDITGQTGMRIMKAIISGERDVEKLAAMRDRHCKATAEVIAQSLVGNYRQEHLFSLKQAVELFEIYQTKIAECEAEMGNYLRSMPDKGNDGLPPLRESRKRQSMSFNVRDYAYRLTGVDLFRVKGFNSQTVLQIISEVGVDLSGFASQKQFASWLSVSPNNRVSGGKVLSRRTKASNNRAAQAF